MPYCPCGERVPAGRTYCNAQHKARYHRYRPATKFGYPRHLGKVLEPGVMAFLYGGPQLLSENSGYRWRQGGRE